MADNYIEKRMEELRNGVSSSYKPKNLDALMAASRCDTPLDSDYKVHPFQLNSIISINARISMNLSGQKLEFFPVTPEHATTLGQGSFIVVCCADSQAQHLEFDLGSSVQCMALKACELGLCSKLASQFDSKALAKDLGTDLTPVAVLEIGHSAKE